MNLFDARKSTGNGSGRSEEAGDMIPAEASLSQATTDLRHLFPAVGEIPKQVKLAAFDPSVCAGSHAVLNALGESLAAIEASRQKGSILTWGFRAVRNLFEGPPTVNIEQFCRLVPQTDAKAIKEKVGVLTDLGYCTILVKSDSGTFESDSSETAFNYEPSEFAIPFTGISFPGEIELRVGLTDKGREYLAK